MNSFFQPELADPELVKQIESLTAEEDKSEDENPDDVENDKQVFYNAFCQEPLQQVRQFFQELVAKYPDKKFAREFFSDPSFNFLIPIIKRNDIYFLAAYKSILCSLFSSNTVVELLKAQAKSVPQNIFPREYHHAIIVLINRLAATKTPNAQDILDYIDESLKRLHDPKIEIEERPRDTALSPVSLYGLYPAHPDTKNEFPTRADCGSFYSSRNTSRSPR